MARPPLLNFAGPTYDPPSFNLGKTAVPARGARRAVIFLDDEERGMCLATFGETRDNIACEARACC
jgi:hypothetical protein